MRKVKMSEINLQQGLIDECNFIVNPVLKNKTAGVHTRLPAIIYQTNLCVKNEYS